VQLGQTNKGSTPRTRRLVENAAAQPYNQFVELRELRAQYVAPRGASPILTSAEQFAYTFTRLTPVIHDGELIVGAFLRGEEVGDSWLPVGDEDYIAIYADRSSDDRPELRDMARRGVFIPAGPLFHHVVDFANVIRTGSAELTRRARAVAETRHDSERDYAIAFAMGHEAIMAYAQSYALACEELARSADDARATELREMARICLKVPAYPAESFHEALQSCWFLRLMEGGDVGRMDVYLNDFYQSDLANGLITPDVAQELIECLLIKLHADATEGYVNISSVYTLTMGGVLPDGSDAANDLTRIFLAAIRNLRLLRPTVYLRCHSATPDDVLDIAVTMLGEGLAEPQFFGDKPIIEGLTRLGVPLEVARDYAIGGCAEVVSPGRGAWGAINGWINLALIVDETLRQAACEGGDVWQLLAERIQEVAEACKESVQWIDEHLPECDTRFETSILMPVTLNRCKDILRGGAESCFSQWVAVGLPNAADMLSVARNLTAAGYTLKELFERLNAGDLALQRQIDLIPKYGNDCLEVDEIAARLIEMLADALEARRTPLRQALTLGHLAGGQNMHVCMGMHMGPTLDGRKRGIPLADSLAGSQGKTTSGPSATINSLCRLNHSRLLAGAVSTLRLSAADFADETTRRKVISLIKTYFELGGSQLQLNVVDHQTLRLAQARPQEYPDLLVRVAGYSAYFAGLGKPLQDEIITRTECAMKGI